MLLEGQIRPLTVKALIDSGNTHCFINDVVVKKLNLPIVQRDGLKVVVANDERVKSKGMSTWIPLQFHQYQFFIDFYILPLDGFDVVLGVN